MLKTPITFCNFFFIWFTSFQRKCNQKQKKDNSIQIVNSPFLVKIKRSKLVIFKLPLSFIYIIQFYINQNTFLPGFIIRKKSLIFGQMVTTKLSAFLMRKTNILLLVTKRYLDSFFRL